VTLAGKSTTTKEVYKVIANLNVEKTPSSRAPIAVTEHTGNSIGKAI